jgi:hypothetical protein
MPPHLQQMEKKKFSKIMQSDYLVAKIKEILK